MKKIKIIMLVITFALSQDYLWNGLYAFTAIVTGSDSSYLTYEITIRSICLCFYVLFSIFFTDDGNRFEAFIDRHPIFGTIVDRVLRFLAAVTYALAYFSKMILVVDEKNKKVIEEERKKAKMQMSEEYRNMLSAPLLLRFIIASAPLIIAISMIQLYSRDMAVDFLSFSSHVAGVIGLVCICFNCTDELLNARKGQL